jgi:pimeloyl-ACP methyl ester carboxylesterase
MNEPRTHTLDVPGAVLHYDIRDAEAGSDEPLLLMIGLPMAADGFTALAGHFPDRTIVTYDPRGVARSERTDGANESNPELHADDLHRLISALDAGPVEIFGSSGGAVVGLTLVSRHPEQVRTLVAHEPPSAPVLPDREEALAATADIRATYERDGFGPAMGKFLSLTMLKGPVPADFPQQPAMDPAMFGLPTEDDGRRDDALLAQNIVGTTHCELDFGALLAAPTRIVIGAGAESEGELANRAAYAVAERLGSEVVVFPSHHGGFVGGESGWKGEPEAFAATLREVLGEG